MTIYLPALCNFCNKLVFYSEGLLALAHSPPKLEDHPLLTLHKCLFVIFAATHHNIRMDLRETRVGSCGLDVSGSGYGPVVGSCDHSNGLLDSMKGHEFID